ncbi:MAG: SNF2-related protein [Candidatus Saccharimonadales bacterium]
MAFERVVEIVESPQLEEAIEAISLDEKSGEKPADSGTAPLAPENWISSKQLINELECSHRTLNKAVRELEERLKDLPDWHGNYKSVSGNKNYGRIIPHFHPEAVELIRQKVPPPGEPAPEGWMSRNAVSKQFKIDNKLTQKWLDETIEEHPGWFDIIKARNGNSITRVSPAFVDYVQEKIGGFKDAPEGWLTKADLEQKYGVSHDSVRKMVKAIEEERPGISTMFRDRNGTSRIREYFLPEITEIIEQTMSLQKAIPEGWLTINGLVKAIGHDSGTIRRSVERIVEKNPELAKDSQLTRGSYDYFHPELAVRVEEELSQRFSQPPDGWVSKTVLGRELGKSKQAINDFIDTFRQEHPDWFSNYYDPSARKHSEHCYPEFVALAVERFSEHGPAPEGWETTHSLMKVLGVSDRYLKRIVNEIETDNPDLIATYLDKGGRAAKHLHPEAVEKIKAIASQYEDAPEGWITNFGLTKELDRPQKRVEALAKEIIAEHPEWIADYKDSGGRVRKHYHPELVAMITDILALHQIEIDGEIECQQLATDVESFISQIADGETIEAKEFQELLQLFGSENAIDILFQHRPEYQKIALPFAKRVIGDYLGEFLIIRGDLQFDNLEKGIEYLSDPNLKQGLTEVIKNNCLRFYNQQRRNGRGEDDLATLQSYIADLRRKTESYRTAELAEVLDEVEEYYKALFEVIQIPDNIVGQLEPGRFFPDINQRINILELMGKQKMLIADEMGVGKSASAILAKETLGITQALIVVPSNVVDVWQKYLSDHKNGNGEAIGYFKEGHSPRVLIINGLDSLDDLNPADYDYVIISQERLTEDYMVALEQFDYEMLIVDEAHKLKNITSGKRADNLVKLAEKIEGDDKYLALLSGTPIPNHVGDIAMVLKLLYPEKFESVANKDLTRQILEGDVLDLRSLLVPRMQMKSLAESIEMPTLYEELHTIQMSEEERNAYEVLLEEDELTASQKLQILRQFALNPQIFEITPGLKSSKLRIVGESLRTTFANKNKVVMFVNGYIDGVIRGENTIFEGLDLPEDIEVHVIDGKVPKARRLEIQKMLQEQSDRKMLLAVSGQTADVGVDFSGAEELYFYNEPWTEYDKRQQQGRVYRPGLKHDLVSHTFYIEGSVEEGIHKYIEYKYNAVEKLLRGIPLSELERELLREDEKRVDPNLEVNPTLAEHYLSSWHRMLKIYNHIKEIGEPNFRKFLDRYAREYAECYTELGSRSYQANANRLAGTVIDSLAKSKNQLAEHVRILDVASGPEMLRRHIAKDYQDQVVSVDINSHHFEQVDDKRRVGSFLDLPTPDSTVDYANLALALHYTKFLPSRGEYERVKVFQELNRVLVNNGVAVINLMHNHDLKNIELFAQAIEKVGFKVVEGLSGKISSANNFRSRMLVLQKVSPCIQDTTTLVQQIGAPLLQGFKFAKTDVKLKDSRKIVTTFIVDDAKKIKARLNQTDRFVLNEEHEVITTMKSLRRKYGSIRNIPSELIFQSGLARAFTGKTYVLFKSLDTGNGAVITR